MLFEDLNWTDVESYLKQDDRVVVITGACEQHAALSLLADIRAPVAIATAACRQENVLIAPPLPYGISPYFAAYPGTLSLRPETFAAVAREVLGGLLAQGFRRVLVANGHGGNSGVLVPLLVEIATANPGAKLVLFEWWKHPSVAAVAAGAGMPQRHANWAENFPFTRVGGDAPQGEKEPPDVPRTASAAETRQALGDGSFGGAYQAPDVIMEAIFAAAVEALAVELRAL
jgi:creatinine amidohydrolase